jgi:hypothetical protein
MVELLALEDTQMGVDNLKILGENSKVFFLGMCFAATGCSIAP